MEDKEKNKIWDKNEETLFKYAHTILKKYKVGHTLYQDWHQELLIAAWLSLNTWEEGGAAYKTYAYTAMRNRIANLIKSDKHRQKIDKLVLDTANSYMCAVDTDNAEGENYE